MRLLSAVLAAVMLVIQFGRFQVFAEENTDVLALSHKMVSVWNGGYQGEFNLKNTSDQDIKDWSVTFTTYAEIIDCWGGEVTSSVSIEEDVPQYTYTITSSDYNNFIVPDSAVTIGYIAKGNAVEPENATVDYALVTDDDTSTKKNIHSGSIYTGDGYTVEVKIPQTWEHGYTARLIISNTSSETLHNWGFILNTSDEISGLYNAKELSNRNGTRLFKNAGYNQDIPAGASIEVGYTAYYNESFDVPQEFTLASFKRTVDMPDYKVDILVTDEWGESAVADIVIENESDESIEDWEIEFDIDTPVKSVWDAVLKSYDGKHCIIHNPEYAQNISPKDTAVFKVEVSGKDILLENVKLTKVVVSDGRDASDNTISDNIPDYDNINFDDETDTDGDGIPDSYEKMYGSDPGNADTDGDGLTDYEEIVIVETDPLVYSSVTAGVSDYDTDIDNDGISNGQEVKEGLDPLNDDSDFDELKDGEEKSIGTDPLNSDTDEDELSDGDEVKIGLDPSDPETFGVPDSEYMVPQTISSNSEVLSYINKNEPNYQLALDVTAAGYVGNFDVRESSYSNAIRNDAIVGLIPSFSYDNSIAEMTIRFRISAEYEKEITASDEDTENEINGIHRLSVAFFSEDLNVCLPIKSSYDDEKKEIYTEVSRTGTYCLMDVKKWSEKFETYDNKKESQAENDAVETEKNSRLKYDHSYYGWHTYALITEKMNWEAAKEYCEAMGGHLLTINDEFEQKFTETTILNGFANEKYWIGGFTKDSLEKFEWVTGERFDYTNWRHGEPNYTNEKNIHIYDYMDIDYFGLWNNEPFSHNYKFICEWDYINRDFNSDVYVFANTWNVVPADFGNITIDNDADYDNDGLKNNEEIAFDVMDDIFECSSSVSLLELYWYFEQKYLLFQPITVSGEEYLLPFLNNNNVILIYSDPTMSDTDDDKITDKYDTRPMVRDNYPEKFVALINLGVMDMNEIHKTSDGFYICTIPLNIIYKRLGYPDNSLYTYPNEWYENGKLKPRYEFAKQIPNAHDYYLRYWYFTAVQDELGSEYSVVALRPYYQEKEQISEVAVPFVSVDTMVFSMYDSSLCDKVKSSLVKAINAGVESDFSLKIVGYFMNKYSEANYLLARLYANIVVENEAVNSEITAVIDGADASSYRDKVLNSNCIDSSGIGIYDKTNNKININDCGNLTTEEIKCILACRTNNPSQNSFAAEIIYHATEVMKNGHGGIGLFTYRHAIRADLNPKAEKVKFMAKSYKDHDGKLVSEQRNIFGDI